MLDSHQGLSGAQGSHHWCLRKCNKSALLDAPIADKTCSSALQGTLSMDKNMVKHPLFNVSVSSMWLTACWWLSSVGLFGKEVRNLKYFASRAHCEGHSNIIHTYYSTSWAALVYDHLERFLLYFFGVAMLLIITHYHPTSSSAIDRLNIWKICTLSTYKMKL